MIGSVINMSTDGYINGVNHKAVIRLMEALKGSDVKPGDRMVLLAIVRFANADGQAWPSHKSLEQWTGYGKSALTESTNRLQAAGWLSKSDRKTSNQNTLYTIHVL